MSSLVFVRDAQGRPLMPMSAAYARTLIQQGKAQVWPHPAFSVIQLTRVVAAPTLRPVVMGVALSRSMADLVFVIDQQRGPPSTIQVVVDLRFPLPLRREHQGWESRRRRIPFAHLGSMPRPGDWVRILLAVVQACHAVIPISHLVLLPSARRTALTPPHALWIEERLATRIRRFTNTIAVVHHHMYLSGKSPHALTGQLIERIIWAAREAPHFVACAPGGRSLHDPSTHQHRHWGRHRTQPLLSPLLEPYLDARGQLCTIRQQRRTITGVLHALEPPDQLVLQVPVQVADQGITWQRTYVPITSSLHVWPSTPIWLLPLAREYDKKHTRW